MQEAIRSGQISFFPFILSLLLRIYILSPFTLKGFIMSLETLPISHPSIPGPSARFQDQLVGPNAFYTSPAYSTSTGRDFAATTALPASYTVNTEQKIVRIAKQILSIVLFPIGMYHVAHFLIGKFALLPAATPALIGYSSSHADTTREVIPFEGDWKYKRLSIEVDGYTVDATIVGKAQTFGNGRWMLRSNGNGEFYEEHLAYDHTFKHLLTEIDANGIVFNYPGVGASSGLPSKEAMILAYKAVLTFLEDQEHGVGAREIIGYGHSIGGGIQGEALQTHTLKEGVKYVFVKSRTFSSLAEVASGLMCRLLGVLVKFFGWEISSVESSKKLQAPEIIMQTANVREYQLLEDSSTIINDGVIPAEASLAKALLDDDRCPKENKKFIGIPEDHNSDLQNPNFLARQITQALESV